MRAAVAVAVLMALVAGCRAGRPRSRNAAPAPRPPLLSLEAGPSIFPASWHRVGVRVRARPLAPARYATASAWLDGALAAYPPGFVEQHVDRVHVLARLRFRGVDAGGSNSRRRLYVVLPPPGPGAKAHFERVVHAELSSVLLRRHRARFDRAAWLRGTVPGFCYGASGAGAVEQGLASLEPTPWALSQGFLYEYGMSSLENDVNSYAAYWLAHPDRLATLASRYPRVAHKRDQIVRFYRALGV